MKAMGNALFYMFTFWIPVMLLTLLGSADKDMKNPMVVIITISPAILFFAMNRSYTQMMIEHTLEITSIFTLFFIWLFGPLWLVVGAYLHDRGSQVYILDHIRSMNFGDYMASFPSVTMNAAGTEGSLGGLIVASVLLIFYVFRGIAARFEKPAAK